MNGVTRRPLPRGLAKASLPSFLNTKTAFTITTLAVLSTKVAYIHGHLSSISTKHLVVWGASFFAQDLFLLIILRLQTEHWLSRTPVRAQPILIWLNKFIIIYSISLSIVALTFHITTGSEIRWRDVGLAAGGSSFGLVLSGAFSCAIVVAFLLSFGWILQDAIYHLFGFSASLVDWLILLVWRTLCCLIIGARCPSRSQSKAKQDANKPLTRDPGLESDILGSQEYPFLPKRLQRFLDEVDQQTSTPTQSLSSILRFGAYCFVATGLIALAVLVLTRPNDSSLAFVSWATVLLPFIDFSSSSPLLDQLQPYYHTGIQHRWDNLSALTDSIPLPWLPQGVVLEGFGDWYNNKSHYNGTSDPMKISNLDQPLLSHLQDKLKDISIRHVIVVFLESARNDMFPIKRDGMVWGRLAQTFPNHEMPKEVQDKLSTLTPTANYITGDYDDGFNHTEKRHRGGVRFTNAQTASTYTLKSQIGTLCGVAPLIADFNKDYRHHIYQPCLPHILNAMNAQDTEQDRKEPYASSTWKSYYFLTSTIGFDGNAELMEKIGFPKRNTIDRNYLRSDRARHGRVDNPDVNYFGFEEEPLTEYIRDAFISAKEKDERVFLTHLTNTGHHPFGIPQYKKYIPVANGLNDLSHYINAQGYIDSWLQKLLNILDEQGVANETLVVFQGDHGLSMPENDIVASYYNPNIGNDHIPLVLSHPKLPVFDVSAPVSASQILPTILDLLLETNSLHTTTRRVATDLLNNYEGQSLIRPQKSESQGQVQWQYNVANPGRSMLTARDPSHPDWHLVVPVVGNVEWRFTNLTADPREQNSVQSIDFLSFLHRVEEKHGEEVAKWVEEGAYMTRWWVEENHKRWRFGPYKM
ncbi:unnamed protein product [Clonostachys byssicola]|uniref:Sulfatase N-terminal domain-containing protein n=1 Tax=Clonostachys byssicola TaxID=160290 RepID=A0A9N9UHX8_9HYPO|nr:unnamed protein product [Clonostachys byssicola]